MPLTQKIYDRTSYMETYVKRSVQPVVAFFFELRIKMQMLEQI